MSDTSSEEDLSEVSTFKKDLASCEYLFLGQHQPGNVRPDEEKLLFVLINMQVIKRNF